MADPANPVLIGYDSILDSGLPAPYGEFLDGDFSPERNRLYLCHWDVHMPGTLIFDFAGPEPLYVGRSESSDFTRFAAMSGNMLYGCSGESGLYGLELVAGQMERRGNLPLAETWGAEARDLVYVASTDFGLVITDWINSDSPIQRGSLDVGQARAVTVVDTVAYVAAFTQGFKTVDVSDPNNPVLLDGALLSGIASVGVDVAGPLAATADGNIGVNFWNVANPADIVWLGNYDVAQKVVDVKFAGQLAYVATNGDSIHVLDIQDPTLPVLLSSSATRSTGLGERPAPPDERRSGAAGGVFAYALSDRLSPDPLFHYYTTGTAKGVEPERLILVADDSALTLLGGHHPGRRDAAGDRAAPLDAWPNLRSAHGPRFSLAANAVGSLDVFDIGGRHLRRLAAGAFGAGQHQFDWDGKDDDGRALASGVCFAPGRPLGAGRGARHAQARVAALKPARSRRQH
jgi:hypothetical protein